MTRVKVTYPTALVLQALARGYHYGFDVMDATNLPSGTVYPILRRLDREELVRSRWEKEAVARREQRPSRRYYEVTTAGEGLLARPPARYRARSTPSRPATRAASGPPGIRGTSHDHFGRFPILARPSGARARRAVLLVPRSARADWLREWEAELRHRWHVEAIVQAGAGRPRWCAVRSAPRADAFWLRRQANADWQVLAGRSARRAACCVKRAGLHGARGRDAGARHRRERCDLLRRRRADACAASRTATPIASSRCGSASERAANAASVAPGNFLDWQERQRRSRPSPRPSLTATTITAGPSR